MTNKNVIQLDTPFHGKFPVDTILEYAINNDYDELMLIGWDKEGKFIMQSSFANCKDMLWCIEGARKLIIE